MPRHIVCVKWGTKYSADYVNKLYNMCQRNSTLRFHFHCVTDDAEGLNPEIKIIDLPKHPGLESWWTKLWLFSSEFPLQGTVLFFDLDVVVFNNIDKLFTDAPGKFRIIRDFNRCRVETWNMCNSSVFRFEAGTMNYIWDEYVNRYQDIMRQLHGDQDWITKKTKDCVCFWNDSWIRSYKWEFYNSLRPLRDPQAKMYHFNGEPNIPQDCCVAVFHGKPNPHECSDQFVVDNWK